VDVQGWWGVLLQGALSAVIGGGVAALTAWAVVSITRRNDRRAAIEKEARASAIQMLFTCMTIMGMLTRALEDGTDLPEITEGREWGVSALATEIAMFSLGQEIGRKISQDLGDARRALEIVERATPAAKLTEAAIENVQQLIDDLADWLMQGRHRQPDAWPRS
jgi:Zn-dependent peptidase ImmA (M78 family)